MTAVVGVEVMPGPFGVIVVMRRYAESLTRVMNLTHRPKVTDRGCLVSRFRAGPGTSGPVARRARGSWRDSGEFQQLRAARHLGSRTSLIRDLSTFVTVDQQPMSQYATRCGTQQLGCLGYWLGT